MKYEKIPAEILGGAEMDYTKKSNEELEQLVNNKDGEAICELGERCLYGRQGHPVNYTRAYQLFHKGEKMGLSRAYIGLGEMYRNGLRFIKNENLAREYYQKAGVAYPGVPETPVQSPEQTSFVSTMQTAQITPVQPSTIQVAGTSDAEIQSKLNQAEGLRMSSQYANAKNECNQVLELLNDIQNGTLYYSGTISLDEYRIEAHWILAYIAFNEQKYSDLEFFISQKGVTCLHPWGAYLKAISHKITQAPANVLEQDLENMIMVSQNPNLSIEQKGDLYGMIGDLLLEGFGQVSGYTSDMARDYYQEAAQCGNEYAKRQNERIIRTMQANQQSVMPEQKEDDLTKRFENQWNGNYFQQTQKKTKTPPKQKIVRKPNAAIRLLYLYSIVELIMSIICFYIIYRYGWMSDGILFEMLHESLNVVGRWGGLGILGMLLCFIASLSIKRLRNKLAGIMLIILGCFKLIFYGESREFHILLYGILAIIIGVLIMNSFNKIKRPNALGVVSTVCFLLIGLIYIAKDWFWFYIYDVPSVLGAIVRYLEFGKCILFVVFIYCICHWLSNPYKIKVKVNKN